MDIAGTSSAAAGGNHIAVPPDEFDRVIDRLGVDPAGYTFVDLGSGKGRALLLAADRGFAHVVGGEFARELDEVALANVERRRAVHGHDARIEMIHGDATRSAFPDGPVVLFIFSAFDPPVITIVIDNAAASWRRDCTPFHVVYMNPVHLSAWTGGGWSPTATGPGYAILDPARII